MIWYIHNIYPVAKLFFPQNFIYKHNIHRSLRRNVFGYFTKCQWYIHNLSYISLDILKIVSMQQCNGLRHFKHHDKFYATVSQDSAWITTTVSMQLNKRNWHTSHSSPQIKQSSGFVFFDFLIKYELYFYKCQLFQISAPEVGPVTNINRNGARTFTSAIGMPALTKLDQFSDTFLLLQIF